MLRINFPFIAGICLSCACFAQDDLLKQKQDEAFELIFSNQAKAILVIDSLIVAHKDNQGFKQAKNYSNKGVYYGVQNELDSAAYYFNKGLEIIPRENSFYPKLANNLAITYKKKGSYQKALCTLLEALEVARSTNNLDALQKIYSEMSSCYRALNNYNLAVEYSLKSIETENKKEKPELKSITFEKQKTANLYGLLGNYSFAEKVYKEIIDYFNESPYKDAKISTYLNYANALIKLNKSDEAISYIDKAEAALKDFDNNELYAFLKLTEANYYVATNQDEKAITCYEKSLASFDQHQDNFLKTANEYLEFLSNNNSFNEIIKLSESIEIKDLEKFGILDLIQYKNYVGNAYYALAQYDNSTKYYKATIALKDSLQKLDNYQIAKDLQAKYQNEIIEQRNTILQERVISEARKTLAILGFSLAVGILLASLMFRYKNQLRAKNKLALALEDKLKAEQKVLKFKDALLETQRKELLSRTYQTIAEQTLNKNKKSSAEKDKSKNNRLHPNQLALSQLNSDFERYYPMFKAKLLKQYPNLTKKDLEFLSFIKLKFTYKDIAKILNITHSSVITKKYRISKKMHLDQDLDLYNYVEKHSSAQSTSNYSPHYHTK